MFQGPFLLGILYRKRKTSGFLQEKVLEHIFMKIFVSFGPFPSFAGSPVVDTDCRLQYSHSNAELPES